MIAQHVLRLAETVLHSSDSEHSLRILRFLAEQFIAE